MPRWYAAKTQARQNDPRHGSEGPIETKLQPPIDEERLPENQSVEKKVGQQVRLRMQGGLSLQAVQHQVTANQGHGDGKSEPMGRDAQLLWPLLSHDQQVVGREQDVEDSVSEDGENPQADSARRVMRPDIVHGDHRQRRQQSDERLLVGLPPHGEDRLDEVRHGRPLITRTVRGSIQAPQF